MTREIDEAPDPDLCGLRYKIQGRIATGGMAEVLEGDDTVLGRRVAIKVLKRAEPQEPAEGAPDEQALEAAQAADRMRVEARALALVAHPNIVAAYDFGTATDGRPFLVTERLIGRSLDAELRERDSLPWEEATRVIAAVLAALEAVHAKGIVHRDVKPGNVFLCMDGSVKLLDFGVAKILGEASVRHVAPVYRTQRGALVGTPKYTTPEQASGGLVDARTDVYAVGLLAYALLTGRHPFGNEPDMDRVLEAMREGRTSPPSRHAPEPIPAALDAAVLKALAWDPAARFSSAAAFGGALREIVGTHGEENGATRVFSPRRGLSRPAFVLAVAVSAALVLAALLELAGGAG